VKSHTPSYTLLGLMSGTSLDGVDLALCRFSLHKEAWQYHIEAAQTIPYDEEWKRRLSEAHQLDALSFLKLHNDYGHHLGTLVRRFMDALTGGNPPDAVASHGHTIFHQPQQGLTFQIGSGATLAAVCGYPVVCDFRSLDVALGGQGAPLVPVGDELLFGQYRFCLNLGGFANISYNHLGTRLAYDLCPANWVLNHYARRMGMEFDKDGLMARSGRLHRGLLEALNSLEFYRLPGPKSLGREWVEQYIHPCMDALELSVPDVLCTFCHHIAHQVSRCLGAQDTGPLLITGGGAHNRFLAELIQNRYPGTTIVPQNELTDYKEALIFAFLGVLRLRGQVNCLSQVTGCSESHSGGVIYRPPGLPPRAHTYSE